MANPAGTLRVDITANTASLRAGFVKATAYTKKFKRDANKSFASVRKAVFSLKSALFGMAGVAGLGAVAKSFITAASTSEQYRVRLKVMLGSVEEGNRLFQDMAKFASEVPFEYENIMNSATQLAGVMKGGVDEVKQWIPLIGDLAATSGLSIEKTTEQVIRMYSAGAASADLFRERGITAMLGFQAGVSVSAEETRVRLMNEWKKQGSQFRGATKELARTWEGGMSMLSDKWFAFRNTVMEGGLFNWIKGLVAVINGKLGQAMEDGGKGAAKWSDRIISALEGVILTVAFMGDALIAIKVIFKALEVAAWGFAAVVNTILDKTLTPMIQGWIEIGKLLGMEIGDFTLLESSAEGAARGLKKATTELKALALSATNQEDAKQFLADIRAEADAIAASASRNMNNGGGGGGGDDGSALAAKETAFQAEFEAAIAQADRLDELWDERAALKAEKEIEAAAIWTELWTDTANTFARGIGDAFADAIVEQKNLGDAMRSLMKQVVKEVISALIQIAIKRTLLNLLSVKEMMIITAAGVANAATVAAAWAPAAAAASLASFGGNAAPAMAGISATHALSTSLSGAREFGGPVSAGRSYKVGERGTEVFTPNVSGNISATGESGGAVNSVSVTVIASDAQSFEDQLNRSEEKIWNGILDRMNEEGLNFA